MVWQIVGSIVLIIVMCLIAFWNQLAPLFSRSKVTETLKELTGKGSDNEPDIAALASAFYSVRQHCVSLGTDGESAVTALDTVAPSIFKHKVEEQTEEVVEVRRVVKETKA